MLDLRPSHQDESPSLSSLQVINFHTITRLLVWLPLPSRVLLQLDDLTEYKLRVITAGLEDTSSAPGRLWLL